MVVQHPISFSFVANVVWSQLETLHKNYWFLKWIHWGKNILCSDMYCRDPANVWFFGAPKTPNIFFLNADQILYSRRFIRHTSPKTNMDTRNGLEKVDSFWIWPSLVSMLDFWGVSSQTWFFTPCFFSTCCRPRSWKARFGCFLLDFFRTCCVRFLCRVKPFRLEVTMFLGSVFQTLLILHPFHWTQSIWDAPPPFNSVTVRPFLLGCPRKLAASW